MRAFPEHYRYLALIGVVLAAGLMMINLAAYLGLRGAVRGSIVQQALPLTGDMLEAHARAQVARPALIASAMAADTFVRDWMEAGENDPDAIRRYLSAMQQEYSALDTFLVSQRTGNYYSAQAGQRMVQESDSWFFRARDRRQSFAADIGVDPAGGNAMTVFIAHRVHDQSGSFLGVAGIGLRMDGLKALIDSQEKHPGRRIYFVDARRTVTMAGRAADAGRSIERLPGIGTVARQLLDGDGKPRLLSYEHEGERSYVSGRFLPELGWHLLVAQNVTLEERPMHKIVAANLLVALGLAVAVLRMVLLTILRYAR